MTKQETFDTVVEHLRQQGRPAWDRGGTACLYRTSQGLKCAVGCLIPDELYEARFEGVSLTNQKVLQHILRDLGHDVNLLIELQMIHDGMHSSNWESEWKTLAFKHDLVYTAPDVSAN